jgi:hypothetical protein
MPPSIIFGKILRLTGHGTITDTVIVLGIMIGEALVVSFVLMSIVYTEHTTGVIAPWLDLEINHDYHLTMPMHYSSIQYDKDSKD